MKPSLPNRMFRLLPALLVLILLSPPLHSQPQRRTGNDFHGFNLEFSHIPLDEIRKGGPPKDGIPALTYPEMIPAERARYLYPDDWVIGVKVGKNTRAYPLRILNYHEIVNDTIGTVPILVSYCPLCRSALVFDRRVKGRTLEFGVSGMLWNSNVLMYDRHPNPTVESLWSQVMMRAVTGPAAEQNLKLTLLPAELTTWRAWRRDYPDTTVQSLNTGHNRNYRRRPYENYFKHDRHMFHIRQGPPGPPHFRNKEPMILIEIKNSWKAYAFVDLVAAIGNKEYIEDEFKNTKLRITLDPVADAVKIVPNDKTTRPLPVAYLFWSALNGIGPQFELFNPRPYLDNPKDTDNSKADTSKTDKQDKN